MMSMPTTRRVLVPMDALSTIDFSKERLLPVKPLSVCSKDILVELLTSAPRSTSISFYSKDDLDAEKGHALQGYVPCYAPCSTPVPQ